MPVMRRAQDPNESLLRPPLEFANGAKRAEYLTALHKALYWVTDLNGAVYVCDALVADCPIVAVSKDFLAETNYELGDMLYRNCCHLLESVTGEDVFRISASSRAQVREYCRLARIMGAIDDASVLRTIQPNAMKDGEVKMCDLTLRRTYAYGHPLIIGSQAFSAKDLPISDPQAVQMLEALADSIVKRLIIDPCVASVLRGKTEVRGLPPHGFVYRGARSSLPRNLLFYWAGDRTGILRQEPHLLPHSGNAISREPLPIVAGQIAFSLRIDALAKWTGWPALAFTRAPETCTDILLQSPTTVGFTDGVPFVNDGGVQSSAVAHKRNFPALVEGDIIQITLDADGTLCLFHNESKTDAVPTASHPADGTWHAVCQVSFAAARVSVSKFVRLPHDPEVALIDGLTFPHNSVLDGLDGAHNIGQTGRRADRQQAGVCV